MKTGEHLIRSPVLDVTRLCSKTDMLRADDLAMTVAMATGDDGKGHGLLTQTRHTWWQGHSLTQHQGASKSLPRVKAAGTSQGHVIPDVCIISQLFVAINNSLSNQREASDKENMGNLELGSERF